MSSDGFAYGSDQPRLGRRPDGRAIKIGVVAFVVVLLLGTFAKWVIDSEQASERRVHATGTSSSGLVADDTTGAGSGSAIKAIDPAAKAAQVQAQSTADLAVKTAFAVATENMSFADAGPGQLSALDPSTTYTDGPSIGPSVVSVASTANEWAGAVLAEDGTCFFVRTDLQNAETKGRVTGACTGTAALDAPASGW